LTLDRGATTLAAHHLNTSSVAVDTSEAAQALQSLAHEERELIEEAYFQGLTLAELAARHHLPIEVVRARVCAGMQSLRRHLSQTIDQ
jgi:DNA-directed RNA polymerase specialized sigma24 family protein